MVTLMDSRPMATAIAGTTSNAIHRWTPYLFGATALILLWQAVSVLLSSRPSIGGVDFYFYVLNARDLADGPTHAPWARYIYFPGVYRFWETVFRLTDGTLPSLQWAYLGILLANAGLVGIVLMTSVTSWWGGLLGSTAYLVFMHHLEGLSGSTEPISTIPFLIGLLLLNLCERHSHSTAGLVCLFLACGICLFVKQQAGLLMLGMTALIIVPSYKDQSLLNRLVDFAIVAIGTAATFVLAMWLDGGGWAALGMGLAFAAGYTAQGIWLDHVSGLWAATQPLSGGFLLAMIVWIAFAARPKSRDTHSLMDMRLLGVTTLSTLAGLLQFSRRGYLHYGLLILPCAIIAVSCAIKTGIDASRSLAAYWAPAQRLLPIAAFLIVLLVFVPGAGSDILGLSWPQDAAPPAASATPSTPQLAALCAKLKPGSFLLIIPARHNNVHWACRTRTIGLPLGYGWENLQHDAYLAALQNRDVSQVLLFGSAGAPPGGNLSSPPSSANLVHYLLESGFVQSATYDDATLYQQIPRAAS